MGDSDRAATGSLSTALRNWFGQPPRRHGEIDEERTVSFLELFYDLIFVVLIAQIAHTLAVDVSWSGVADFAIVFGLIWIAWSNGSLYHELHGREDGRSRTFIFVQMLLLVVLAVYAGHAADEDGRNFALTYSLLLVALTIQWYGVRRYDDPSYHQTTDRYIGGMLVMIVVTVATAWLDADARLAVWAVLVAAWVISGLVQLLRYPPDRVGMVVTESMSERFGLFTIIVLGEVVVGVVDGLSEVERDTRTMATGLLALTIGFGFWWNYFDFIGRRIPRRNHATMGAWLFSHLPMAGSIAAAGAGMVSLIEHAGDERTPAPTGWLLGGSTALVMVCIAGLVATIDYGPITAAIVRPVISALLVGAAAAVLVGAARPIPWLLALVLSAILAATWFTAFALRATRIDRSSVSADRV